MACDEKWVIGSKWKLNNGDCVTVVDRNEETGYFCVARTGGWYAVKPNGYFCHCNGHIVGPWEEKLDIVVGGVYLTESGKQVYVLAILPEAAESEYPVIGIGFTKTGYGFIARWGIDSTADPQRAGLSRLVTRVA